MKVLYVDMDNLLVDFKSGIDKLSKEEIKKYENRYDEVPNIFSTMLPLKGAINAYEVLSEVYDTYILSTAPWENASAWHDKVQWVKKYLSNNAHKRLILTHHKNLNKGNYLIDDRLKNGADKFVGKHIHFGTEKFPNWESILDFFKKEFNTYARILSMRKTIAEKISILISVGSESIAKSELINIVADTEIETLLYKKELDYNFKSKDEKIFLLKGLILLDKLQRSNKICRPFARGSVAAYIWLYNQILNECRELLTPEIEDWINNVKKEKI